MNKPKLTRTSVRKNTISQYMERKNYVQYLYKRKKKSLKPCLVGDLKQIQETQAKSVWCHYRFALKKKKKKRESCWKIKNQLLWSLFFGLPQRVKRWMWTSRGTTIWGNDIDPPPGKVRPRHSQVRLKMISTGFHCVAHASIQHFGFLSNGPNWDLRYPPRWCPTTACRWGRRTRGHRPPARLPTS